MQNPTMHWVFQVISGISILRVLPNINGVITEIVTTNNAIRKKILPLFDPLVRAKYGFS